MSSKIAIHRVALVLVALFLIAGALIIALNWKEMRQVLGQANWFLSRSLFFVYGAFVPCLGFSSAIVFRDFPDKRRF